MPGRERRPDPESPGTTLQSGATRATTWQEVVDAELAAMEKHDVWRVMDLPLRKQAIGSRMLFDRKRVEQVDGIQRPASSRRHKVRIVAKGFTHVPGVDYTLTYVPVCKYATLRAVLPLPRMTTCT